MLYVFYIDNGYMLMLDPPPLGTIHDLRRCIADATHVEVHDQVLLLPNGCRADPQMSLQQISDGKDDLSPIFMLKRLTSSERVETTALERDGINELYHNWQVKVEQTARLNANSTTVIEYCNLAKAGLQMADLIIKFCAKSVSEHQLLNKGWMVVISNLDDNIVKIEKSVERNTKQSKKLDFLRQKGQNLFTDFDNSLAILSKIVIPKSLLPSTTESFRNEDIENNLTMYDWISSTDPAYSLESLAQHMLDHLAKVNDDDLVEARNEFTAVKDLIKIRKYRDISGIDMRLALLDSKLRAHEEKLSAVKDTSSKIVQHQKDNNQAAVNYQRIQMKDLSELLKILHDCAICFINSKTEVLNNIRLRLSTWIKQAHEHLHKTHKKLIIFEDKFEGLKQRLDLAKQIKDAPFIYMAAIAEVIRRDALQKEFDNWINIYTKKATEFINEENSIRNEFIEKLERNFVRQLFGGMTDNLPNFIVQSIPRFDCSMPKVNVEYLTNLREAFFKPLEPNKYLEVPSPEVFKKLLVIYPNQNHCYGGEELQIRTRPHNFPSSTWLSVDDIDISPSTSNKVFGRNQMPMNFYIDGFDSDSFTQTPPRSRISNFLRYSYTNQPGSPLKGSAPIAIPSHNNRVSENNSPSEHSFGTPNDNLLDRNLPDRGPPALTCPIVPSNDLEDIYEKKHSENTVYLDQAGKMDMAYIINKLITSRDHHNFLSSDFCILRQDCENMMENHWEQIVADFQTLRERINSVLHEQILAVNKENAFKLEAATDELKHIHSEEIQKLSAELELEKNVNREKDAELDDLKNKNRELLEQVGVISSSLSDLEHRLTSMEKERNLTMIELERFTKVERMDASTSCFDESHDNVVNINSTTQTLPEDEVDDEDIISTRKPGNTTNETNESSAHSAATQTRIRMKDIRSMVPLNELYEGCAALLFWDIVHNAFIAYCTSQILYFVSDESLPALGLKRNTANISNSSIEEQPSACTSQRGPNFALVTSIEMCRTKRPNNRYNLPTGCRFYRITVVPLN